MLTNKKTDTSNLEVNAFYKNYKLLCSALNEEVLSSDSKTAQLNRWARYFSWERKGQGYLITEIYDDFNIKKRKPPQFRTSKYYDDIYKILLFELYFKRVLSKSTIAYWVDCGFVNKSYLNEYRRKQAIEDSDENDINQKYSFIKREFINDCWKPIYQIFSRTLKYRFKKLGYSILYEWAIIDGKTTRVASLYEKNILDYISLEVLELLNCEDISQVYLKKLDWKYFAEVSKRAKEQLQIDGCYKLITITAAEEILENEFRRVFSNISYTEAKKQIIPLKKTLNTLIIEMIEEVNKKAKNKFLQKTLYTKNLERIERELKTKKLIPDTGFSISQEDKANIYYNLRNNLIGKFIKI